MNIPLTFKTGECEIQVLTRAEGFRDLGDTAKITPLRYGEASEFLTTIAQVEEWAKANRIEGAWAPIGVSTYFDYRLKLDHFDRAPFPGEPSNQRSEVEKLEAAGFSVARKYHTHELVLGSQLRTGLKVISSFGRGGSQLSLARESLTPESLIAHSHELARLTHEMFKDHFAYEPMSPEMFRDEILRRLLRVVCFRTSFILRDKDQKLIGYSLHLIDPSDPKRACLKTFGIDPSYPHRARAFFSLLKNMEESLRQHYDRVYFCLIAAGSSTDRLALRLKPIATMTYGLFYKSFK